MGILSSADAARVTQMLAGMVNPARLAFFTQTLNCERCEPTAQILRELAALTDKIIIEEHNFLLKPDLAAAYGVDRVPARRFGVLVTRPRRSDCARGDRSIHYS